MTRDQVFTEVKHEFDGMGELTLDLPRGFFQCEVDNGWVIYNFGVRWVESPNKLHVVTYGPDPVIVNGKIIHHRTEKYVCWAT